MIPGLGRFPGEGNGNLLQYSCLENLHGQRSLLAGYRPWGCKELDTTEHNNHNNKTIFNFYLPEEDFLRMVKIMLMKMVEQ